MTDNKTTNQLLITAGDKDCYVYFDTEFTGLIKNSDLISIGLVNSNGNTFYAEFNDFDEKKVTPWINENVYPCLSYPDTTKKEGHWTITGNKEEVRKMLIEWLDTYVPKDRIIQFVSDVCHYDFVLLIDLLTNGGSALDLPRRISPCCSDINQDIATSMYRNIPEGKTEEEFNRNFVPIAEAFNISREEIAKDYVEELGEVKKHNALYDAKVIRAIHRNMWFNN